MNSFADTVIKRKRVPATHLRSAYDRLADKFNINDAAAELRRLGIENAYQAAERLITQAKQRGLIEKHGTRGSGAFWIKT